jgi:CHAT domain-containing protein
MRYTDLQLLARDASIVKTDDKKLLTFTLILPGVLDEATKCELDLRAVRDLKRAATSQDATWKEAAELGEALSSAMLPTEIFNSINNRITEARAKEEGLRIRLILSGSQLNNLPWEFLLFNRAGGEAKVSDFLCLMPNVSVVRHPAITLPVSRVEATSPVKIMIAAASPEGWPLLDVSQEVELIKKALENNPHVEFSTVEHAKIKGIPDKTNPAHIFHFAGHGQFEQEPSATPGKYEGTSSVILEDEVGDPKVFSADLLAERLRDAGVRVAVLGACQTAQRDDVKTWSSVAETLLKAELGAVVGMQFPVLDVSATAFAEAFYGALAIGLSIDEAVSAGRVAVASADDARGWANPALYLRAPDGVIFPTIAKDQKLETARQQTIINVSQRLKKAAGKLIGIEIRNLQPGLNATVKQDIDEAAPGSETTGAVIG